MKSETEPFTTPNTHSGVDANHESTGLYASELDPSERLQPRLSTSKTWTELPAEFITKIRAIFTKQFLTEPKAKNLALVKPEAPTTASRIAPGGEFIVEGRIYADEVILRVGHLEQGRLRQINFEASMDVPIAQDIDPNGESGDEESLTMGRLYTCIDILGSLIEEYFDKGSIDEIDIPRAWQPFEFETETVYLQYSTINSRLEEEADRILGLLEEGPLVRG